MTQFFAPLAEPVGAIWCLIVLGVLWLVWRRQWQGAVWLGVPAVLIFLIGSTPLVDAMVARAERPYARADMDSLADADVVVALGGGYYVSEHDMFGFALDAGGSRVLTALELVRRGKAQALVLGGSGPLPEKPGVAASSLVQEWILASGMTTVAVTNLGLCANTHDEAVALQGIERATRLAQGNPGNVRAAYTAVGCGVWGAGHRRSAGRMRLSSVRRAVNGRRLFTVPAPVQIPPFLSLPA